MRTGALIAAALVLLAGTAGAQGAKPLKKCPPDAVLAGTVCMDKYEASVWRVPNATTTNAGLVKKIQAGKATYQELQAAGASKLGFRDDYAPCGDDGQNCVDDVYAVSLPLRTPSAYITWFQAQEACANARKRLPTSAEWQVAANGTPDTGGVDDGATDCNTDDLEPGVALTGSRTGCVSLRGAFDMVGNLREWVADWVPRSTTCTVWAGVGDDYMCLAGADAGAPGPGALLRGGFYASGTSAGPLAVEGGLTAAVLIPVHSVLGFRCAR